MAVSNDLDLACAWQHTFNVAPNRKGPFGYLLELSGLGGMILGKDIVVWNPLAGRSQSLLGGGPTVSCVGVLERFGFGGDATDPIRLSCFVSQENRTNLRARLSRDLTSVKVRLRWTVAGYDDAAKAWFQVIETEPARLDGVIHTVDGALQISVDAAPTRLGDDRDLEVYRLALEIVPPPRAVATIKLALGQNQRIAAEWGED